MNNTTNPKSFRAILSFLFIIGLICVPWVTYSQDIINLPEDVHIEATGTGQTTGDIVRLIIINEGDKPFFLCINKSACNALSGRVLTTGMMFIPSLGKYQSYIVTGPEYIEAPPGSSDEYSLEGFCADIHTPPVPVTVATPNFNSWIFQGNDTYNPEIEPNFGVDLSGIRIVERIPQQPSIINVPSDSSINPTNTVQVDLTKNPKAGASFIFDALTRIEYTVDSLLENNLVTTPFHSNPNKERESIIQQVLWIYTSVITGQDYTEEDFSAVLIRQVEEEGVVLDDLTELQQQQFQEGIGNFWSAFSLVGAEAKVLNFGDQKLPSDESPSSLGDIIGAPSKGPKHEKKLPDTLGGEIGAAAGQNPGAAVAGKIPGQAAKKDNSKTSALKDGIKSAAKGIATGTPTKEKQKGDVEKNPPEEEEETEEKNECECGYISFFVNVKANDGKYDRFFEVVGDFSNSNGNPEEEFKVEGLKVKPGDQIEISVSDVEVTCNCSSAGIGECVPYKPKKDYSDDERDTRSKPGAYKIFPGLGSSNIPIVRNNKDNSENIIEIPKKTGQSEFVHIIGISSVCVPDFCGDKSVNCVSYAVLSFDTDED